MTINSKNENTTGACPNGYTRIEGALSHVPVSERTWHRWKAQGRIPYTKIGRVTLYRLSDIDKMLAKMTVRAIG